MRALRPRFLLAMCGNAQPEVQRVGGDYDAWFRRAFGQAAELVRRDVFRDQPLGDLRGFDGLVISGSTHSVCDLSPWMDRTAAHVRELVERGLPVLGVCFGHQLLAHAFGGTVEPHPAGREIGTVEVELTPAGQAHPLFAGLLAETPESAAPRSGARLRFNCTHGDHVSRLPAEARVLAQNGHSPVQAFHVGRRGVGVQFHPELDRPTMRAMIQTRKEELLRQVAARGGDGEAEVAQLLESVEEAPAGAALLREFARAVADGRLSP